MAVVNTCSAGHVWESIDKQATDDTCPICGGLSRPDAGTRNDARLDQLPPLPHPSPFVQVRPELELRARPGLLPAIDGFDIEAELGRGGIGVVYRARQLDLNRTVAIKMLLSGELADEHERGRFRREAEAIAQLEHPNIVQVHSVGEHSGRLFLCMEFVKGPTLAQALAAWPIRSQSAAKLITILAKAVHTAHQQGITHRDLKPANVLCKGRVPTDGRNTEEGSSPWDSMVPKITDFGLAKRSGESTATRTGAIVGTPTHMAPEQAAGRNEQVGPASDVYALGAILFECLTGRPPFRGATPLETMQQVIHDEPISPTRLHPGLARDLETICLKCLQKDPVRRYASAAALADDLDRFVRGDPVMARPVGIVEKTWKWVKRRPAVAAGWGVGLLGAMAVAITLMVSNVRLQRERNIAERNFDAALEAVDRNFTFVSEDLLLNAPHMEPVRRKLLQSAREFYERFVAERGDDPRLRREWGLALARLGNITHQIGSNAEAREYYQRAATTLGADLPIAQIDQNLLDVARTWIGLGFVCTSLRETKQAEDAYQRALEACQKFRIHHPTSGPWRQVMGQAHHNLGELARMTGRTKRAEQEFRLAVESHQAAAENEPDVPMHLRNLAHTLHNLALMTQVSGDWDGAEESYLQALTLRQQLADEHPNVPQFQSDVAATYTNLGGLYFESNQVTKSEVPFRRVVSIQERLAQLFPDVVQYQVEHAEARTNLGSLLLALDRTEDSEPMYRAALATRTELVNRFPDEPEYRTGLAQTQNNLGALYGELGDFEQAEKAFRAAAEIRELLVQDHPSVVQYQFDLSRTYYNLALLQQENHQYDASIRWSEKAERSIRSLLEKQPENAQATELLSHIQNERGTADQVTPQDE